MEVRIIEVDAQTKIKRITEIFTETIIETTIEMTIWGEEGVGLGKDNLHIIIEGMTEAVVDQDQVKFKSQYK